MYYSHTTIIYIILFLVFGFPLVLNSFKKKLFGQFSFNKLISICNTTILYNVIVGIVALIIAAIFDKVFYTTDNVNIFVEIFIEATYSYIVIGLFFYLPSIGLLNLINWTTKKLKQA